MHVILFEMNTRAKSARKGSSKKQEASAAREDVERVFISFILHTLSIELQQCLDGYCDHVEEGRQGNSEHPNLRRSDVKG